MTTTIKLPEFAERLRERLIDNQQEVVWFLGAGCSISSGIKAAGGLVDDWLNKLHQMRAPDQDRNEWARSAFKGFDPEKPALHYAEIFEARHPNAADRQQEIERICAHGEAAYGYATLAQIITDTRIGPRCNMVLTTNFDDLLVEAIYMYGALQVRPQIITHEAVVHYARVSQTRPTIIKLHGDAHLDPKNLRHETALLDPTVSEHLHALVKNTTLVFLGYGGNDQSIVRFLTSCPWPTLPQPVYWVGTDAPSAEMSQWLDNREAVRVDHRDFDVAMHLVRLRLEIPHPDESRWTRAKDRYLDALKSYTTDKKAARDPETRKALKEATEQSPHPAPSSAWDYMISALEAHDDPDRAEAIYKEGIGKFGDDAKLLGNYALFLKQVRKDMDGAEAFYKRALDADPYHANNLANYALFLEQVRKEMDGAEAFYKRALDAEPHNANTLGNYAVLLEQVRKEADGAEALYKRALDAEPDHTNNLRNYALFLEQVRKEMDGAEALYKRALDADPGNAVTLGTYAVFLEQVRKEVDGAEAVYKRALDADPDNAITLGDYASFLRQARRDMDGAEVHYKRALDVSPDNAITLGSYAIFLKQVRKDMDGAETFFKRALDAAPDNVTTLGNYALFLEQVRKDMDGAEALYKRALDAEPDNANTLCNYADFLSAFRKDTDGAEELYKRALDAAPDDADTLGGYAIFLQHVRTDMNGAESLYKRAIDADPADANVLGNYAQLLLAQGRENGLDQLDQAIAALPNEATDIQSTLGIELAVYAYAHDVRHSIDERLKAIKTRVLAGERAPGWDFSANIEQAQRENHLHPTLLKAIASVVSEGADVATLDAFPQWRKA